MKEAAFSLEFAVEEVIYTTIKKQLPFSNLYLLAFDQDKMKGSLHLGRKID